MTITAMEAFKKIEEYATKKANKRDRHVPKNFPLDKKIRQGDIYITRIKHPENMENTYKDYGDNQLAPGFSEGSRHIASGNNIKLFTLIDKSQKEGQDRINPITLGPVIINDEPSVITHPTHGNVHLPPGAWQITYQLDFASKQRVRD